MPIFIVMIFLIFNNELIIPFGIFKIRTAWNMPDL